MALLGAERHNCLVGDSIRRVVERRPDVLSGQPWIRVEKIGDGGALCQFAEQKLHGHAGPSNYGLALHDSGIDLDTLDHASTLASILLVSFSGANYWSGRSFWPFPSPSPSPGITAGMTDAAAT